MARLCKHAQKQSVGNESRVICMKLYHPTKCGVCGWSRLAQTLRAHSPLARTPLDSWVPSEALSSHGWRERKGGLLSFPASLALCFFLQSRHSPPPQWLNNFKCPALCTHLQF